MRKSWQKKKSKGAFRAFDGVEFLENWASHAMKSCVKLLTQLSQSASGNASVTIWKLNCIVKIVWKCSDLFFDLIAGATKNLKISFQRREDDWVFNWPKVLRMIEYQIVNENQTKNAKSIKIIKMKKRTKRDGVLSLFRQFTIKWCQIEKEKVIEFSIDKNF